MSNVITDASERLPQPGDIARVRQRLYLVENVVGGRRVNDSPLVRLACVDDDNQGVPLEVLWDSEVDREVITGENWDAIAQRGFDPADAFASYVNTLKWNCVTSTNPRLFQSPFRAGIKLDAYQLEPLRKALLLPRVNLFIADDVGLGKTIEAGLIARELLLRKRAKEIVVAAPPSMLTQWKDELEVRFGLTFEILDRDYIKRVRQERGFGVNPWTTHSRFLISHRLLIDEHYAGPLRDWLGAFQSGSMLILDEAHHAAPASGQKYAIDSKITRAVEDFAKRFEHRLFLSATPHNGHSNSFSRLLELLDPQRFCRGVPVTKQSLDDVMVRRLKEDIRNVQGGFPKRTIVQVDIDGLPSDAPELELSRLLDLYRNTQEERLATQSKRSQASSGLLITGLQKRLLSSIEAFAHTLHVHRGTVRRRWDAYKKSQEAAVGKAEHNAASKGQHSQLDLLNTAVGGDDERAELDEDQLQAEQDSQFADASEATTATPDTDLAKQLWDREQELLDQMTDIAEASRWTADAKVRKLIDWIRAHMLVESLQDDNKQPAIWADTRVIIFTEWEDTKRYLVQQLSAAIANTQRPESRIEVFSGSTSDEKRTEIKRAFNSPPSKHPVRILIATESAREGLNLQAHCSDLFHFDVPWNPSRMEQRNGRIDRKLQPAEEVRCHYFYYAQRPEDRVLRKLVEKTKRIRAELGSLSQVIDTRLDKKMADGIRRQNIDCLEQDIEDTDLDVDERQLMEAELEISRERQEDLRVQIDRLRNILDSSRKTIGLNEDLFRLAISSSLSILGADPLKPQTPDDDETAVGPPRCVFPALDQIEADWADTIDTLRVPRKPGQKPWEWRRESPVRPVVFEDPAIVTDDVVHLHLEHRVVQRLLGRFISQGFVFDDLSRACLTQTKDAIPRVILLGRLALYGPGATRLHEELVPVTARWTDPADRDGPLYPYARSAETKTLSLLDEAFHRSSGMQMEKRVAERLQSAAAKDISELLEHLQTRGDEFALDAEQKLTERAEAEAKAMVEILDRQRKHIIKSQKAAEKRDWRQLEIRFDGDELAVEEEKRQLNANMRYWATRLEMLRDELKTEPDRIRELYTVKAKRIEPVGLVYLWPVTG